jgi:hypothetical protein
VSAAFAKLFCTIGAIVLGVATTINAYGLEIQSWPWLIWGVIGQLALMAAGGCFGGRDE